MTYCIKKRNLSTGSTASPTKRYVIIKKIRSQSLWHSKLKRQKWKLGHGCSVTASAAFSLVFSFFAFSRSSVSLPLIAPPSMFFGVPGNFSTQAADKHRQNMSYYYVHCRQPLATEKAIADYVLSPVCL